MKTAYLRINAADNVAVAIEPLKAVVKSSLLAKTSSLMMIFLQGIK